jgi:hypothetical protein
MNIKSTLNISLIVLTFLSAFLPVEAQVSLKEIALKDQIKNSSLVIEGKVIAQRSFWDAEHKLIYTANTVEVFKVFKGETVSKLEVLTQGGTVGLEAVNVSHALKLRKGDIGVFNLYDSNVNVSLKNKNQLKQYKTYSSLQGFYKYDLQSNRAINTFSQRKGIQESFYKEIQRITNRSYNVLVDFNVIKTQKKRNQKNSLLPPANITFSPSTITAGTKSVLTINGTGFGASQGKVGFRNADDGGATFLDALDNDILTWTDTQITINVPGFAGTGAIRVTDALSTSSASSSTLTVSYALLNAVGDIGSGDESSRTQHYGDNNDLADGFSGGYTWEMFTDFFDDTEFPGAKNAFMRAFNNWRCETKVNWEVSATATTIDDNSTVENVIRFDNGTELEAGVLGTCISGYSGRLCSGEIVWYVTDLDIVFDSGTSWYFGTSGEVFDPGEYDFETVALHELGHGHQLGHVINTNNIMHYSIANNDANIVLDANSIAAGNDVQSLSSTSKICGMPDRPLMTNYAGSCNLNIEENSKNTSISLYPNPANQEFFIENSSSAKIDRVAIYDVRGRLVKNIDVSEASKTIRINMINASRGVYFVLIHSQNIVLTKKLVLE